MLKIYYTPKYNKLKECCMLYHQEAQNEYQSLSLDEEDKSEDEDNSVGLNKFGKNYLLPKKF